MIILACETSTLLGSVAVLENDKVLSFENSMRQGSHSDVLNQFIERALKNAGKTLSDIDLFASGIGPGSFTGIRISLNTIKTLAYCCKKPAIGINSLQSLAAQAAQAASMGHFKKTQIVSMINAYKNMIYIATYRYENSAIEEIKKPEVLRVQNLEAYLSEKSIVCGDGFHSYEKFFTENTKKNILRLEDISDEPHAKMTGQLAFENSHLQQTWNTLVPLYLRASEAEENLQGIKFQPLN